MMVVGCISQRSVRQEISVAAAADLQFAMQDIAGRFQKETGKTVKPIYGSSGNFFSRFRMARPSTYFFPRTSTIPKNWKQQGLTEPGSYYRVRKREDRDLGRERFRNSIWVPE